MGEERPDGAGMAPDVRLELTHGPEGSGVLADGRALAVAPNASATEVGLAAARRHAVRTGRDLRVEVVDGASVTTVSVGVQGFVTLVAPPEPRPSSRAVPRIEAPVVLPQCGGPEPRRTETTPPGAAPTLASWARPVVAPAPPGRPMASLVVAALVAAAVLFGAIGTGVATLASSRALPDACRPVTVYAVGGAGGASDVLQGVTGPLSSQFGEKLSVVTVPPPPSGGSYASSESDAVGSLANAVSEHVDGCPTGSLMFFGYSQGAQVAGDLVSRVGTGLEPRIPANLVQAVGLFGDPARSPGTRAVPDGTTGQGALPPRAVGFGSLDARTIEICAPGDPVCDSPTNAAAPALEQAVASPVHGSYPQLPVAAGTTAPRWAAASLGKVVAAIPTDAGPAKAPAGTAPQSGPVATSTSGPGSRGSGDPGEAGAVTTTPAPGDGTVSSDGGGSQVAPTTAPGADSGTSATGGTGYGAGTASRGSGSGSVAGGAVISGAPSGKRSPSASSPTAGSGSAGTPSPGTVSDGRGSAGTGSTSSGAAAPTGARSSTGSSSGAGSGEYGSESGSGSATATSSAPSSSRSSSGSASESSTTTSSAPARGGGSDGTASKKRDGQAGTKTDAAFSLTDGLDGFKSTPWNNQNATDPSAAASPNVPGREAVKFEMPGGGKRTEAEPDVPEFQEGQKAFVGYSGFFDKGFPTNTDTWQVIMQFKQPGTGSPPLAVEVGKGQLRLANDGTGEKDFCPVTEGAFSFQLGVTFGGAVDAWCNGKQTLTGYTTPQSNVKGSAYLKTGIYRDESIKQPGTLFLNDLKVGKTFDSVSGLAGADGGTATDTTTDSGAASTTAAVAEAPADRDTGAEGSPVPTATPASARPAANAAVGTATVSYGGAATVPARR